MRFGFHISISGGFSRVVSRAAERGCETIQFFSRNPRGWKFSPLDEDEVVPFRKELDTSAIDPAVVHMPYLPNLASADPDFRGRSIDSLAVELERAHALGAAAVITHVGRRGIGHEARALELVAAAIGEALERSTNGVSVWLENTAGMGSEIGHSFAQLKRIFDAVPLLPARRLGLVLDTAHAFEAGYDLATRAGLDATIAELDRMVGLDRLKLLHLNDSKTDRGSRIDRHWHIGEGRIGRRGFQSIVNHPALRALPGIMETPRIDAAEDLKNLATVRALVRTGRRRQR